jgi:hypothetical protein
MRVVVGTSAIVVFLFAHSAALSQSCPVNLSPSQGNYGYRPRPMPDRCEGLYTAPVAGGSVELLSFLIGRPFDPLPDHRLVITVPDVNALGAQKVAIVAHAMQTRIYYRMDVTVPSAGSVQWPLGAVLLPAGLKPENIGLVGSAQSADGSIYYVPLQLSTTGSAAPQSGSQPVIVFRTLVDSGSFLWRLYDPHGAAPPWNKYDKDVKAGEPIAVTLDPLAGKVMVLDVAARPRDADFIQINLKVFRQ